MSSIDAAKKHESICWKNPANKTCLTCKFHRTVNDSDGSGDSWWERHCDHPTYEAEGLDYENKIEGERMPRPIVNCNFWEKKNGN